MTRMLGHATRAKREWFTNYFKCVNCDTEWVDEWDCACDDDCPKCGTVMTPYESEIEPV